MKKGLIIILLVCFTGAFSLVRSQDLNEYLRIAIENNPGLKASWLKFEADLQKVPQVGNLKNPEIGFGYFISPIETRVGPQRARFSAMQMFPWFGTLSSMKDVAARQAMVSLAEFEKEKNELFYLVRERYYQIYEVQRKIVLIQRNLEIMKSFEELSGNKYSAGMAEMVDILRVQIEIREMKTSLQGMKDKMNALEQNFNLLLNRNPDGLVFIPDTLIVEMTDCHSLRDSLINNPLFSVLQKNKEVIDQQLELNSFNGKPTFSVGVNYFLTGQRSDMAVGGNGKDALMAMGGVNIPIYRKQYSAREEELDLRKQVIEQKEKEVKNKLEGMFEIYLADIDDAQRRIELNREQILQSRLAITLLLASYSAAGKNFEEVLRMQQSINNYEFRLEEAVVDLMTTHAKLEKLAGWITINE